MIASLEVFLIATQTSRVHVVLHSLWFIVIPEELVLFLVTNPFNLLFNQMYSEHGVAQVMFMYYKRFVLFVSSGFCTTKQVKRFYPSDLSLGVRFEMKQFNLKPQ